MLNGNTLRDAILASAAGLEANRHRVDELNVFPVPDGDTGTNMSMTLSNAVGPLKQMNDAPVYDVIQQAAKCLLRGARGNSGVILSLMFRGFAKGFKGVEQVDSAVIANALTIASDSAYKAVMKPTEGTILTVLRGAAEVATEVSKNTDDALETFEAACKEAHRQLDLTPEILPVLKKAGVVDSGGAGLCVIFDAALASFKGEAPAEPEAVTEQQTAFAYGLKFAVQLNSADLSQGFRAFVESKGNLTLCETKDDIMSFEICTDNPLEILNESQKYGEAVSAELTRFEVKSKPANETPALERVEPTEKYGFVTVAAGEGIAQMFSDLGADIVVQGGQTMNPSTQDILNAVEATPAKTVFVLPNNKNIIMAAEQAIPMASRKVCVLPTRSIPMGIGAMMAFDDEADVEQNLTQMRLAADATDSGLITYAVRDSEYAGHSIKKGEIMAINNGKLTFVETDIFKAVVKLVKELVKKSTTTIMLMYGDGVSDEQAEQIAAFITERYSNLDVVSLCGGQPVYHYIISVD